MSFTALTRNACVTTLIASALVLVSLNDDEADDLLGELELASDVEIATLGSLELSAAGLGQRARTHQHDVTGR